jgi:hypothetical protein
MKRKLLVLFTAAASAFSAQVLNVQEAIPVQALPRQFQPDFDPSTSAVTLGDTLAYFYNKHFFRNQWTGNQQTSPNSLFPGMPVPQTAAISHCGGVFLNNTSIQVVGLEGATWKLASAPSASVPVKLYLCYLNGAGMPILPALDSVNTVVSGSGGFSFVGGNFNAPITVTNNFAVLIANASTNPNDTIVLVTNNAATPSSTFSLERKYGEGLGRIRSGGNWFSMTNVFGTGNDREFLVQPRISVTYTADFNVATPTVCTNASGVFVNTSAPTGIIENRQFNFNQFYKHWSPWALTTNSLINNVSPDSVYRWDYAGANPSTTYQKNGSSVFNTTGVQNVSLTASYRFSANLGFYLNSLEDIQIKTVVVSSSSAPLLTISGPNALCAGQNATLTASGNNTFTWTSPASTQPSIVVNPNFTTTYTVTGAAGGCVGSQTFQVQVAQVPILNVTAPTNVCAGKLFTVSVTGASSYTWSTGPNTPSITASSTVPGVSSYTVTGENAGCAPVKGVANIIIDALPDVLASAETTLRCIESKDEWIPLSGLPQGGAFTKTVHAVGNVTVDVNGDAWFVPKALGFLPVRYTYTETSTGCVGTSTVLIKVDACAGVNENGLNQDLLLFPNPAVNGIVHLQNLDGENAVQVFNMLGEMVKRQTTDSRTLNIDLSPYPQGQYMIRVTDRTGRSRLFKVLNQ